MADLKHALLAGGPYGGNVGELVCKDEPPKLLTFSLGDRSVSESGLLTPGAAKLDDGLQARYVRADRPQKIVVHDDAGRARSVVGLLYRYDVDSPCERLFAAADADAKLTATAIEQVRATRSLLLDELARKKETQG